MGTQAETPRFMHSKPPFTLGEIKRAIPPHCFKRSILRSSSYLLRDIAAAYLLYYVAANHFHQLPCSLAYLAWLLYWISQGCILFGVWLIGHECGHHAFSDYKWLNDIVGLILHSALLTPYFSWKISHRRHHANTNSLELDEVHVPTFQSQRNHYVSKYFDTVPLVRIVTGSTLGWNLYLCFNIAGRKYDKFANHFDPWSPIFTNGGERIQVVISDVGILIAMYWLYQLVVSQGLVWVVYMYSVPLLVANSCILLTSYLQHTHVSIPHYDSSEWEWLRGALATVDRDYGFLNNIFHNLNNTHVVHHLFSTMPHYHAKEATNAIKHVLGNFYNFDGTSIWKAVWRENKECIYIQPDEDSKKKGVFWYTNKL